MDVDTFSTEKEIPGFNRDVSDAFFSVKAIKGVQKGKDVEH